MPEDFCQNGLCKFCVSLAKLKFFKGNALNKKLFCLFFFGKQFFDFFFVDFGN